MLRTWQDVGRISRRRNPTSAASGRSGVGDRAVDGKAAAGRGFSQRHVGLRFANPTYIFWRPAPDWGRGQALRPNDLLGIMSRRQFLKAV